MYSEQALIDFITTNTTYTNVSNTAFNIEEVSWDTADSPIIRVQHVGALADFDMQVGTHTLYSKVAGNEKLITVIKFACLTTDWVTVWLKLREVLSTFRVPDLEIETDYSPYSFLEGVVSTPPGDITAWEMKFVLAYLSLG